jgi:hypothetical protein
VSKGINHITVKASAVVNEFITAAQGYRLKRR